MDNVLIVVDDREAVKAFVLEFGLDLEGQIREIARGMKQANFWVPDSSHLHMDESLPWRRAPRWAS